MSPRKEFPDSEPDELDKRLLQRMRKESARRERGQPEASQLAERTAFALWYHRTANELTQRQLGEILGMKQPQIARLESGFVEPSMETLARISERLGIDFTIEVKSGALTASATPPGSRQA